MHSLALFNRLEKTNRPIELDLWIPEYEIAVEFQGMNLCLRCFFLILINVYCFSFSFDSHILGGHHYYNMVNAFGPNGTTSLYSERDLLKLSLCQTKGVTLIFIPYWYVSFNI